MKKVDDEKHFSLRIDAKLLEKFSYVAAAQDRSMNSMLVTMIRKTVKTFEEKNGKIDEKEDI